MSLVWSTTTTTGTALIFAISFGSKLGSRTAWQAYLRSIRHSRALPESLAEAAAVGLAVAEAATVCLLIVPPTRSIGSAVACLLSAALTVSVAVAVARHSDARCQCFGSGGRLSPVHLVRNAMLTAFTGSALLGHPLASSADGHWPDVLVGMTLGLVVAALIIGWEDMVWALGGLRTAG
jgi:Methylamine utilisation protein MauE